MGYKTIERTRASLFSGNRLRQRNYLPWGWTSTLIQHHLRQSKLLTAGHGYIEANLRILLENAENSIEDELEGEDIFQDLIIRHQTKEKETEAIYSDLRRETLLEDEIAKRNSLNRALTQQFKEAEWKQREEFINSKIRVDKKRLERTEMNLIKTKPKIFIDSLEGTCINFTS
jgi:hypothetical protein